MSDQHVDDVAEIERRARRRSGALIGARAQPLLAVSDVPASSWDVDHHHGAIGDPAMPNGNGVLLWFEIEDFDAAVGRAGELDAEVILGPLRNPPEGPGGPAHREIWLRDPDGYAVVLASPDGEAA